MGERLKVYSTVWGSFPEQIETFLFVLRSAVVKSACKRELPVSEWSFNMGDSTTCGICLSPWLDPAFAPCNQHAFCLRCLQQQQAASAVLMCAECRAPAPPSWVPMTCVALRRVVEDAGVAPTRSVAPATARYEAATTPSVTLEVPTECVGVIIGRKGAAIKALQHATSTSIRVIQGGRGATTRVVVTGARPCAIEAATVDIEATVARVTRERDGRRQFAEAAALRDEQRRRESAMRAQRDQQRARDVEEMRAAGVGPSSLAELQAAAQRRSAAAAAASAIAAIATHQVVDLAQLWLVSRPPIKIIKQALALCRGNGEAEAAAIVERDELLAFAQSWVLDDLVNWPRAHVEVLLVTLRPAATDTNERGADEHSAPTDAALRDQVRHAAAFRLGGRTDSGAGSELPTDSSEPPGAPDGTASGTAESTL